MITRSKFILRSQIRKEIKLIRVRMIKHGLEAGDLTSNQLNDIFNIKKCNYKALVILF